VGVAGDAGLDKRDGRKSAANGRQTGESVWRGFINVNLNPSQKAQFEDWLLSGDVWVVLAEAVGAGCHVALKKNPAGGGFLASITQRNPLHQNTGLCITARSSEAEKALFRAVYLVAVLGVDADWAQGQAPADPDGW